MQNKANFNTEDRKQKTEDSKIMAKATPNVFYNCLVTAKAVAVAGRESSTNRPFYAKQTQFPKRPNERN